MSRSRRDSLLALDHGLLVLRRLWQRGELRAFFASRLDKTIELEHYRTLNALRSAGRPLAVNELATALRIDASTASRLVDRMVARGYVARGQDADDRRRTSLGLTSAGWSALATLQQVRVEALAEMTRGWSASDVAALADLLGRLDDAARGLEAIPRPMSATRRSPVDPVPSPK